MPRMKRLALLPVFLCLLAAPLRGADRAPDFASLPFIQTNLLYVPADAVLPDEQWIMAQTIILEGDARDDLFLLAGTESAWFTKTNSGVIRVSGSVGGNLWAAGQTIDIPGSVEHHLRCISQSLRLDGRLGGNLWGAATTVILDTNAIVAGSARIRGGYVYVSGTVDGNLVINANKVVIDGTVNGSVSVDASELSILSNTRIRGGLVYDVPGSVTPAREAVIEGGLTRRAPVSPQDQLLIRGMTTLLSLIGAILVGIFFLLFAPRLAVRSALWMETNPWRTLGAGLAVLFLIPPLAFVLFVSLLGIPLALVSVTLWGLALYMGRFVAALSIARLVTGKRRLQPIPSPSPRLLLLGLLIFYGSSFLPDFLSDAFWLWFTVTGLGGLVMACRSAPLPAVPIPPPVPKTESTGAPP